LRHASEHYDAIADRNRQLAERQEDIRGRLAKLLGRVKALGAEIRP
jgi:hypothetical protein